MVKHSETALPWRLVTYQIIAALVLITSVMIPSFFSWLGLTSDATYYTAGVMVLALFVNSPSWVLMPIILYGITRLQSNQSFSHFPFKLSTKSRWSKLRTHHYLLGTILLCSLGLALFTFYLLDGWLSLNHLMRNASLRVIGPLSIVSIVWMFLPDFQAEEGGDEPITLSWSFIKYQCLFLLTFGIGLVSLVLGSEGGFPLPPDNLQSIATFLFTGFSAIFQLSIFKMKHGVTPATSVRWDLKSKLGRLRVHRYLVAILCGQILWGLLMSAAQWLSLHLLAQPLMFGVMFLFGVVLLNAILTPINDLSIP